MQRSLFKISEEGGSGHRPIQHEGCGHSIIAKPGHEGDGLPMPRPRYCARSRAQAPLWVGRSMMTMSPSLSARHLPKYSPHLKPIEQAFSKLKALLRKA